MADTDSAQERIRLLEAKVASLELVNRHTVEALELAATLGDFETSFSRFESPRAILHETAQRMRRLAPVSGEAIYLISEDDGDLVQIFCEQEPERGFFDSAVEDLVESRTLAWAMQRRKPVFSTLADGSTVFLHALATASRIRGVYVGVMHGSRSNIPDSFLLLASIVLLNAANSLESFELYRLVNEMNAQLKEKVLILAESEAMLNETQRLASLGGWEYDAGTGEVLWTREVYRIHEIPPDWSPDLDQWASFFESDDRNVFTRALRRARDKADPFDLSLSLVSMTGRKLIVRVTGRPVVVDGETLKVAGAIQDITEAKRIEEELREARSHAEQAVQAKSMFLATMSHEIRTPLAGILGMTELAMHEDPGPDMRERVAMIDSSARTLLTIVNDILDYSRMEAQKLELQVRPFDLPATMRALSDEFAVLTRTKGLAFSLVLHPETPRYVHGDQLRILQILRNLVSNSLKCTEEGEVVIRVRPEKQGKIRFSVRDSGPGVPEDLHEKLFQSFIQLDSSYASQAGGAGLGLAICKELVELMSGTIGVVSRAGMGSEFHFTIPLPAAESCGEDGDAEPDQPSAPAGVAKMPARPLSVLVAEDNHVNQVFIANVLTCEGHTATCVEDGAAALEVLDRKRFDLVIMDIQMPGMDGLEATKRIRSRMHPGNEDIPILALTAYAMDEDAERFLSAGMDGYLSKPVSGAELLEEVARLTGVCRPDDATPAAATPGVMGNAKEYKLPTMLTREQVLTRMQGDGAILARVCQVFLEDMDYILQEIDSAIAEAEASGATARVARLAHSLKSSSRTVGAMALAATAREMEKSAEKGAPEAFREQQGRLRQQAVDVAAVLADWASDAVRGSE